ncbi:MAG TPA: type II toxin-antitoxin system prevent-host-death family antitoxin [Gemmatirosa sp.]
MATYNLYDAKNALSELVERAVSGEEVVIARRNVPAVRMIAVKEPPARPEFGRHRHLGRVTDAFFEPLPDEEMQGLG